MSKRVEQYKSLSKQLSYVRITVKRCKQLSKLWFSMTDAEQDEVEIYNTGEWSKLGK